MGQLAVIQTHVPSKIVFFAWPIQSLFSLLWLQYLSVENIWICLASERQGYWQGKSNRNSMRVIYTIALESVLTLAVGPMQR